MLFCRTPCCKLGPLLCGFSGLILPYLLSLSFVSEKHNFSVPKGELRKQLIFFAKNFKP